MPLAKPMLDIGLRVARVMSYQAGGGTVAPDLTIASRRVSPLNAEQCAAFYNWMHRTPAPDMFIAVHFSWDWERRITTRDEHDAWVVEVAPARRPAHGPVYYEVLRPMRTDGWSSYPDLNHFEWRQKRYAKRQIINDSEWTHSMDPKRRFALFRILTLLEIVAALGTVIGMFNIPPGQGAFVLVLISALICLFPAGFIVALIGVFGKPRQPLMLFSLAVHVLIGVLMLLIPSIRECVFGGYC